MRRMPSSPLPPRPIHFLSATVRATISPMSDSRRIAEHSSGNVVGWLEEPETVDPNRPSSDQLVVKIAVIDDEIAKREPFPTNDIQAVVDRLLMALAARGHSIDCSEKSSHPSEH